MNINRKQFLTAAVGLTGGAFLPEKLIAGTTAQIPAGEVKITNVKPYVFKKATFVKIETDAGISGWGEADHDYPKLTAAVIDEICKKELIGDDPFDSEYLWHNIFFKGEDAGSTGLLPGALAGVDNALWDLKGKILNLPVNKISGGFNIEKVRVYGSFAAGEDRKTRKTPDEMAKTAVDFVSQGYKTIKARMQIRQLNIDPIDDDTFRIIAAIRKAVGDDIEIFVDYNNGFTPAKAISLTRKLVEHFNIAAIEEPVTYHDYHGLRQVVEGVDIPVMAGEHEFNRFQMRELITVGNPNFINADLIKAAGFSECRKIAYMAHAFDKFIMTHNTRPTLATAASLQLVASIPNAARVQEYAGSRIEMGLANLFENNIEFDNGFLIVPTNPGLGLIVNEQEMEKSKLN
ncbi:MAG TPA: mandelate racemase/muconate lactonizing enzyme family protein [Mariniphaga anaerophila]|uniref:Mandelate racemase/muconate lactonizing enzyme family protein n=1 Tax=Mariniphaga anaerophila TaxID=1484053 RepID=A0A831LL12_9BACT|nr:mandelate racemase/muconate lactonizing enzyme family protein [Mariniphaga anaerophila]